jgi:hypothetical protein
VHATTGAVERLTDDAWDEKEPAWSPDGRRLAFASDRLAPVVLEPVRRPGGFGRYALYTLDLSSREVRLLVDTGGEDHGPAWSPDGRRIAFVSDRSGASNLFLHDLGDSSVVQLTDLTGGIMSLSWARRSDRLVFAAFDRGGYDIFAVQQPLSQDAVVARLRARAPGAVLSLREAERAEEAVTPPATVRSALAEVWPDSLTRPDTTLAMGLQAPRARWLMKPVGSEPPPWSGGGFPTPALTEGAGDTTATGEPLRTPLLDRGGAFALADTVLGQAPSPYRWRLSPEGVRVGALAAGTFGFAGSTQLYFSDFLGDHSLYVAGDVFSNSLSDANALAIYSSLPHRLDWSVGAFHFKNYFQSRVTSLGEPLSGAELFSERSFGVIGGLSRPFDRFRRAELQFTQMFVEEQFYDELPNGDFIRTNREYRTISSPSLSLVGDNALFGEAGPVNGGRWNLTYAPAFAWFPNSLAYHTATWDVRRYFSLSSDYSVALRVLAGASEGRDPQSFRVGGFSTIRGYRDFDLIGTRLAMVNVELRYPFIDQLGLSGPLPLGSFRMRGALFADLGTVWDGDVSPRFWLRDERGRHLRDPYLGFGTGIRTWLFGLPVKLDVGWATDLDKVRRPRWHFSIGPEF